MSRREIIEFTYNGNPYTGVLVRSEVVQPSYYWVVFEDPEIKTLLGNEIPFFIKDGKLKHINTSTGTDHHEVYSIVTQALEKYLFF
jgi:hypothetical protein